MKLISIEQFFNEYEQSDSKIAAIVGSAIWFHDKTNQRYGDNETLPYGYHIVNVVNIAIECLKAHGEGIHHIVFGAAFHDTIEDARLTYNDVLKEATRELGSEFKQDVAATEIVYALTNEKGRNRDERANDRYYNGIVNTPYARYVKLCDRYANMLYSLTESCEHGMGDKYKKELPNFLEKLHIEPGYVNIQPYEARVVELIKELL